MPKDGMLLLTTLVRADGPQPQPALLCCRHLHILSMSRAPSNATLF
jgi:hypothetical protein